MKRIAAIDLGTNTVRILVAEANGEGFYHTLYSDQLITRLGQGLHKTGRLEPDAMRRTCAAVAAMLENAKTFAPFTVHIATTSAGREADNTATLDAMIREATGAGIDVIGWEEEARLALKGARLAVGHEAGEIILFDIGGGSTEYILGGDGTVRGACGTNLGVVRLAETYITRHPVKEAEYERMRKEVAATVKKAFGQLGADGHETIVGTAGTVTSLAAIALNLKEYAPAMINNFRLTREAVELIGKKLFAMTIEERSRIPALSGGREDLIIPGVAITLETMEQGGKDYITVSDYGLREGLTLELLEKTDG